MSFSQNFLDFSRITLWNQTQDGYNQRCTLGFRDGNPRFNVFPSKEKGSFFQIPFDTITFATTMARITAFVNAKGEGDSVVVTSKTAIWENDKPTNQHRLLGKLTLGKTKGGVYCLVAEADEKPKGVFPFKLSQFHEFLNKDGDPVSPEESSESMVRGWVEICTRTAMQAAMDWNQETAEVVPIESGRTGKRVGRGSPPPVTDEFESEGMPF